MIYIVQGQHTQEIKIGCSKDPSARCKRFVAKRNEPVKVLALLEGDHREEKQLHARFSQARIKGEWFFPTPELLQFIETVESIPSRLLGKEFLSTEEEVKRGFTDLGKLYKQFEEYLQSLNPTSNHWCKFCHRLFFDPPDVEYCSQECYLEALARAPGEVNLSFSLRKTAAKGPPIFPIL